MSIPGRVLNVSILNIYRLLALPRCANFRPPVLKNRPNFSHDIGYFMLDVRIMIRVTLKQSHSADRNAVVLLQNERVDGLLTTVVTA